MEEEGRLKLFNFVSFPELVTRFLNFFLRRIGWWTHHSSSRGDHRRWFHVDEESREKKYQLGKRNYLQSITLEHVFLSWTNGLQLTFKMRHDAEGTFSFVFGIPFLYKIYINFDVGYLDWIEKFAGKYRRAEYGFELSFFNEFAGGRLYWKHDSHEQSREETDRVYKSFYWRDIIYGQAKHSQVVIYSQAPHKFTQPAQGSRPESEHIVYITKTQTRWKYPRFYLKDKLVQTWDFNFESVKGDLRYSPPQFSGKGECSHDLDDDGIYGCSFNADEYPTIEHAIRGYILKVQEYRNRRG